MSTGFTQEGNSIEMNSDNTQLEMNSEPGLIVSQKSSEEDSAIKTWRSMKETAAELLAPVNDAITVLVKQNRGLLVLFGWALVALIGLKIIFAVLDAINDLLLIPLILELVGISYVAWFVYRYLMKATTRQELRQKIDQIRQDIAGAAKAGATKPSIAAKKSIVIHKSPQELYQFWRNLENLPRFMNHIESVQVLDNKRSHWVAKTPLETTVEWDAEIIEEAENKTIVWRSLEGSEVDNVGSVAFTDANGSGTEVKVTMEYTPPGGYMGEFVGQLSGENLQQQLDEDLKRFKQLMETGTVASIAS